MNPVIAVSRLAKRYGKTVAVSDVSLDVRDGEIFGLIGPKRRRLGRALGERGRPHGTVRGLHWIVDADLPLGVTPPGRGRGTILPRPLFRGLPVRRFRAFHAVSRITFASLSASVGLPLAAQS
ncbi:MAG: hypothetical protein AABZ80_09480, partial [Gemmatimonadota bacterium]